MVILKGHCKLLFVCIVIVVKRQEMVSRVDTNSCKYFLQVENLLQALNDQESAISTP